MSIHEVQIAGDWASIESVKPYAKANIAKKRELLQRKVVRLTRPAPGPFKSEMTLSEHCRSDEDAQAEARRDEFAAIGATARAYPRWLAIYCSAYADDAVHERRNEWK